MQNKVSTWFKMLLRDPNNFTFLALNAAALEKLNKCSDLMTIEKKSLMIKIINHTYLWLSVTMLLTQCY